MIYDCRYVEKSGLEYFNSVKFLNLKIYIFIQN